ncbi:hypothetical protein [Streptomyces rubiginosohelvolus]|uniref:hypothetical protein n=1 Tax=Streptomyces rubiginosohelvolus TaxID=67362 RepID=UPI003718A4EC
MDSDRLEEPFRSLAERLLFATACASDASGWVIPGAGLPSSSPARALPSKERAFQALEKVGHPLSSGRLLDEIGGGVGIVSLKSQLSADNRFVRSDVDAWALSDWGMRPYTSIKALVSEELDKAGGELAASRIVEVLTTEFSIKEGTLRQTIAVAPFTSRGGVVRRRADVYEEDLAGRHAASMGREASREHGDSHAVELTRELGLDW